MADGITISTPSVNVPVTITATISGEERLRNFANTLTMISRGNDFGRYWKSQEALINDAVVACERFQKVASSGNAKDLVNIINALQGTSNTNIANLFKDFDKSMAPAIQSAKKMVGEVVGEMSPDAFKKAFEGFAFVTKDSVQSVSELQGLLSKIGASTDVSVLQDIVRQLNTELAQTKINLQESEAALESYTSGHGIDTLKENLRQVEYELEDVRVKMEDEFRNFLRGNDIADSTFGFENFQQYIDNIRDGTWTAKEAISQFRVEYRDMFNDSGQSGLFNVEQVQQFTQLLTESFSKIEEISAILRSGGATGGESTTAGVQQLIDSLGQLSNVGGESQGGLSQVSTSLNDMLVALRDISSTGIDNLDAVDNIFRRLLNFKGSDLKGGNFDTFVSSLKQISEIPNLANLTTLSNISLNGFKDLHISKASLSNLSTFLPTIASVDMSKIQQLASIDFSNLSSDKFKVNKSSIESLSNMATSFQGPMESLVKALEMLSPFMGTNTSNVSGALSSESQSISEANAVYEGHASAVKTAADAESAKADASSQVSAALKEEAAATKEASNAAEEDNTVNNKKAAQLLAIENLYKQVENAQRNWSKAEFGNSSGAYSSLQGILDELDMLREKVGDDSVRTRLMQLRALFVQLDREIGNAGERTKSFSTGLSRVEQRFAYMFSLGNAIMLAVRKIKDMAKTTIELDSAMTQLRVVTNASESDYADYGKSVTNTAKEIGASITDLIDSTTVYARLGYSLEESSNLSRYTAMLANVGNIDVSTTQDALTAITKAFNDVDASNIESAMDKMVVVGNNFPISVSQIAEGMNNAGSALAAAGNSFGQSVALLTAANTTVQDISKSSTGLRTITARIRKTKIELDDLGESIEEANYQKALDILTKNRVALTQNGEFRSTYDILKDIASVWDELSSMEQANVAEQLAGNRQQNVFYSLMGQFQEAEKAMSAMDTSEGALESAYAKYSNSVQKHINTLKASFQDLSRTVIDSDMLKGLADGGSAALTLFTKLFSVLDKIGGVMPVITAIGSGLIWKGILANKADYVSALKNIADGYKRIGLAIKSIFTGNLGSLKNVFSASSIGAVASIVAVAVSVISSIKRAQEERRAAAEQAGIELTGDISKNTKTSEEQIARINELKDVMATAGSSTEEYANAQRELLSIQNGLVESYGTQAKGFDLVAASASEAADAIRNFNSESAKQSASEYLTQNQREVEKARKSMEKVERYSYGNSTTQSALSEELSERVREAFAKNGIEYSAERDNMGRVLFDIEFEANANDARKNLLGAIADLRNLESELGINLDEVFGDTGAEFFGRLNGWLSDTNKIIEKYGKTYDKSAELRAHQVDAYSKVLSQYEIASAAYDRAINKTFKTDAERSEAINEALGMMDEAKKSFVSLQENGTFETDALQLGGAVESYFHDIFDFFDDTSAYDQFKRSIKDVSKESIKAFDAMAKGEKKIDTNKIEDLVKWLSESGYTAEEASGYLSRYVQELDGMTISGPTVETSDAVGDLASLRDELAQTKAAIEEYNKFMEGGEKGSQNAAFRSAWKQAMDLRKEGKVDTTAMRGAASLILSDEKLEELKYDLGKIGKFLNNDMFKSIFGKEDSDMGKNFANYLKDNASKYKSFVDIVDNGNDSFSVAISSFEGLAKEMGISTEFMYSLLDGMDAFGKEVMLDNDRVAELKESFIEFQDGATKGGEKLTEKDARREGVRGLINSMLEGGMDEYSVMATMRALKKSDDMGDLLKGFGKKTFAGMINDWLKAQKEAEKAAKEAAENGQTEGGEEGESIEALKGQYLKQIEEINEAVEGNPVVIPAVLQLANDKLVGPDGNPILGADGKPITIGGGEGGEKQPKSSGAPARSADTSAYWQAVRDAMDSFGGGSGMASGAVLGIKDYTERVIEAQNAVDDLTKAQSDLFENNAPQQDIADTAEDIIQAQATLHAIENGMYPSDEFTENEEVAEVAVDADTTPAQEAIDELDDQEVEVTVDAETKEPDTYWWNDPNKFNFMSMPAASDEPAALSGRADDKGKKTINVSTNAEEVAAEAESAIESVPDKEANITTLADLSGVDEAQAGLNSLPSSKTISINFRSGGLPKLEGFATGTRNAPGGPTLVNELGPELISENGRAYIAGGGAPTVVNLSKGAIVLDAEDTKKALSGKKPQGTFGAAASGKKNTQTHWAYIRRPDGSIEYVKVYNAGTNSKKQPVATIPGGNGNKGGGGSGGNGGGSGKNGDDKKNKIDWIEVAIDRLTKAIDSFRKIFDSAFKTIGARMAASNNEIAKIQAGFKTYQAAYTRYIKEANSVGLSADLMKLVQNGTIDIRKYDDGTQKKINEYKQWYEKALQCKEAIDELHESLAQLYLDRFSAAQRDRENQLAQLEHQAQMVEKDINLIEQKGYLGNASNYQKLADKEAERIERLREELSTLRRYFDEAMKSGEIKEQSDAWYEMMDAINAVEEAIADANSQLVEYQKSIRQIQWDYFDFALERFSQLTDEAEFLISLMQNDKLFDEETGKILEEGMATMGLHVLEYNAYMAQADEYAKELAKIEAELAKDPYDTELIQRREELLGLQQQSILNAESEKDAVRDLVENGINAELNALKELIDAYKDSIDSAKDLYEYQKKISEKTQDIAKIQKQLAAYAGDTSDENRARVQKLNEELKKTQEELKEAERDQSISEQKKLLDDLYEEYEELLNERLDNIDELMREMVEQTNANLVDIRETIEKIGDAVGYDVTSGMGSVLSGGGFAYYDKVFEGFTAVTGYLANIYNNLNAMARASGAVKAYASGGLADYTGYAMLHGTRNRPELVLNASDTQNLLAAAAMLRQTPALSALGGRSLGVIGGGVGAGTTIGSVNVTIPIDHVQDYNDMLSQMRDDPKFERLIGVMTLDAAVGKSSFRKNSIKF